MWISVLSKPKVPEYVFHQYCWQYFPDIPEGEPRPFLYRVLGDSMLMLSRLKPATSTAVNIADRIECGKVYQFDLLANPARGGTITIDGVKRRVRRRAYSTNEELKAWIHRRFEDGGADITFVQSFKRPTRRIRKGDGNVVTVCDVVFRGTLMVKDLSAFKRKMLAGIGGRGAWGCGLLVLPEIMTFSK